MSRIEEALEKALEQRKQQGSVTQPVSAPTKTKTSAAIPLSQHTVETRTFDNPLIVTANDPNSHIAEEFRKLKSLIVGMTARDEFRNTLMVTSSIGGEGKSLTSANLAVTLAQEYDYSVLLIDADLRKPSLDKYLQMNTEYGLADCLMNGIDVSQALCKTGIGKLTLLPAGHSVSNPVELFSSTVMRDLLDEIKNRYHDRYVIIDTPPVLPFAETRYLSNLVEGIILVAKEGYTTLDNVRETLSLLEKSKVLGLVYNEVSSDNLAERFQYYSYYYLRDGAAAAKKKSAATGQ